MRYDYIDSHKKRNSNDVVDFLKIKDQGDFSRHIDEWSDETN